MLSAARRHWSSASCARPREKRSTCVARTIARSTCAISQTSRSGTWNGRSRARRCRSMPSDGSNSRARRCAPQQPSRSRISHVACCASPSDDFAPHHAGPMRRSSIVMVHFTSCVSKRSRATRNAWLARVRSWTMPRRRHCAHPAFTFFHYATGACVRSQLPRNAQRIAPHNTKRQNRTVSPLTKYCGAKCRSTALVRGACVLRAELRAP